MRSIVVGPTQQRQDEDEGHILTATTVVIDGEEQELWHSHAEDLPTVQYNRGDIWLPVVLIVAMRRGEPLTISDPVSDEMMASAETVQDILLAWYPDQMSRVSITAPPSERAPWRSAIHARVRGESRPAATCFSGGVDSFYSLIKNDDVEYLMFALGLDIPLHQVDTVERVSREVTEIGREFGKQVLLTRTNIRRFTAQHASWGYQIHGAALASLGVLYSPVISRLYIPATHSYAVGFPWGSHPLLDPLWTTERLSVVHDGAESTRAAKITRIADNPVVQGHVRVCLKEWDELNCGRCAKCLRTMAALDLLDQLPAVRTFPDEIDLDALRDVKLKDANDLFQFEDCLRLAHSRSGHDELTTVLEDLVDGYRSRVEVPS